jgi:hypothetical protein
MSSTIKPTVIKTEKAESETLRPTVIRPSAPEPLKVPTQATVAPSIIGIGTKLEGMVIKRSVVTTKVEKSKVEKAAVIAPSKMKGFERNRLPISREELKQANPNASETMIEKSLQYVLETNFESIVRSSALVWQTELQKRYSDKVMQLLECTQHQAITKAGSQVSRIVEILQAIDLHGVCDYEKDGMISKFLKNSNKEFDTPEELNHAEKELKQLTHLLGDQMKALIGLQQKLQELNHEIKALAEDIKAAGIAASFLAHYLPRKGHEYEKIASQFHERGISLLQTEAQIFENEMARDLQHAHPIKLIEMIQNTILVMIPDWLGSAASIRSMLEMNKKVTVTEVEEISVWKKNILKRLK